MKKYIFSNVKYRRSDGDHLRIIELLEKNNPDYEFCQFINDYTAIMRLKNLRKLKLENINNVE